MAEKKQTYKEIVQERDAYKHELDVIKQDRVNRQAKNSVFLNLFMRKEYQLQLYKELFPADTTITEDDLELVTLDNVLTIHPYNDLGLLARGKLIVLTEAQSTWSVNIIFRLADYYFDSAMSYWLLVMRVIGSCRKRNVLCICICTEWSQRKDSSECHGCTVTVPFSHGGVTKPGVRYDEHAFTYHSFCEVCKPIRFSRWEGPRLVSHSIELCGKERGWGIT